MVNGVEKAEAGDFGPEGVNLTPDLNLRRVLTEIAQGGSDSADYIRFVAQRALLWDGRPVSWSLAQTRLSQTVFDPQVSVVTQSTGHLLLAYLQEKGFRVPDVQPHGASVAFGWEDETELTLLLATGRAVEGMAFRGGKNTVRYGRITYSGGFLTPSLEQGIPKEPTQ